MAVSLEEHRLVLLRHAGTEWSATGQHTGRTEVELTDVGREQAAAAAAVLDGLRLVDPLIISSPRRRARDTAELAGLKIDELSEELVEWDYGRYEGFTTPQIRETVPGWLIWTQGAAGGESVEQVSQRADRALTLALQHLPVRDVVFVGHGHFSRAVIARWLELPLPEGIRFGMTPASVAVCSFEHGVRQLAALGLTGYRS